MTKLATGTEQTGNPTSATTQFEFTVKPWKPDSEFDRFEKLAWQLIRVPKSDVDAKRKKSS